MVIVLGTIELIVILMAFFFFFFSIYMSINCFNIVQLHIFLRK